ncbi:hypothetical protein PF005_g14517 [Phytophthora fragariae]|uniref:RxLR effector protein n=1 Tax=Phytophthora fragariae TaxID=53985 RepID=A0A6A3XSD6_9STRA|nr:hypothetical protein PF003_g1676 [Phytophthora fragariae]KAE8940118.1 hypothetical protein PF009_g10065 [Phytophthora fragariae]KAE9013757.1 hypothetical protein PF011_g8344 [Phytophthora fragariae]KAE9116989.1 hypothetical protein PF010_g8752 [Phytophthora fragariae]KAE9118054.1 hypothetical protein PF007_g9067 [Phytophthora fragariae]
MGLGLVVLALTVTQVRVRLFVPKEPDLAFHLAPKRRPHLPAQIERVLHEEVLTAQELPVDYRPIAHIKRQRPGSRAFNVLHRERYLRSQLFFISVKI